MNLKAKRNILFNFFLFLAAGAVCFSLIRKNIYDVKTFKDPVFGTAEIIGIDSAIIGKPSVKYRFHVAGKAYISDEDFSPKSNPKIGDFCQIMYSESNPRYSKPLVNVDKTLKILRDESNAEKNTVPKMQSGL